MEGRCIVQQVYFSLFFQLIPSSFFFLKSMKTTKTVMKLEYILKHEIFNTSNETLLIKSHPIFKHSQLDHLTHPHGKHDLDEL